MPTTYTQDLVAPLPVVLQAKTGAATTQYLYTLGTRPLAAARNGGAWEYLMPDALGSVRQIVDANGNVTLAESYEPYGSVLTSTGPASSIFGYAGEQADTTGLIYLRARYMNPRLGIFLTEDTVPGNSSLPRSLHIYAYAWNNPVNLLDPSGKQVPPPQCKPGDICSTGPTALYSPQTPAVSPSFRDPLSYERWLIAKREAQNFQIPIELVAGTVAVEIVHDTDILDPFFDTYFLMVPLSVLYCPSTAEADKAAARMWLEWYNAHGCFGCGTGAGPGVANVHVKTAMGAEYWFAHYYQGTSLNQLLARPSDNYIRLANLVADEGNIRYTAGILRQLADQRTGRFQPHFYEPEPKLDPQNVPHGRVDEFRIERLGVNQGLAVV